MSLTTPLHDQHLKAGAKMVDFGGWDMPVNYGSQVEEHHVVRRAAGMFDVSHMTVVDVQGAGAQGFLQSLLANDVGRLTGEGQALYSCMLNEAGGVIDDLIAYRWSDVDYRLVVNASTREKDLQWIKRVAESHEVRVSEQVNTAMIAVQGPAARGSVASALHADAMSINRFCARDYDGVVIARTGYTGEDGFEIMLPAATVGSTWETLLAAGVKPCGLGARDTLRLEAGMSLYGQDMDETISPLECGLDWTVAWQPETRGFIGRAALLRQQENGPQRRQIAVVLEGRGVLRHGQLLFEGDEEVGEVTSGTYSPTLEKAIGLALVAADAGNELTVDIRGKRLPLRCVRSPFVRHGTVQPGILQDDG